MSPPPAPLAREAVVVRVSGPSATVMVDGLEQEVRLTPRVPGGPAVAGDRVRLHGTGREAIVVEVEPRTTLLSRGTGRAAAARPIVANAELLVVVAAVVDPPLHPRLIDRYLAAAAIGGLEAAIVITKADLPHDAVALERILTPYRRLGHETLVGVARQPELIQRIRALIGGRTAILAGHSGVGKSTITAALTGVERAVGAVSAKVRTGRHTTSDPRLIPLPGAGAVVDTAGVRTFHLPRMDRATLESGFPDIALAAAACRFRGCAHTGDAGCAVVGAVSSERLESYRRELADMR